MAIRSVLIDAGGFLVERKMLEVRRPPFLSYWLPIDTPEQLESALAFAEAREQAAAADRPAPSPGGNPTGGGGRS
jgi:hypothetical protein